MSFYTADLCDAFEAEVRTLEPVLSIFGERLTFGGPIRTLRVYEDNSLVKASLAMRTKLMPATLVSGRSARAHERVRNAGRAIAYSVSQAPNFALASMSTVTRTAS